MEKIAILMLQGEFWAFFNTNCGNFVETIEEWVKRIDIKVMQKSLTFG